jgi:hypothetical protein
VVLVLVVLRGGRRSGEVGQSGCLLFTVNDAALTSADLGLEEQVSVSQLGQVSAQLKEGGMTGEESRGRGRGRGSSASTSGREGQSGRGGG